MARLVIIDLPSVKQFVRSCATSARFTNACKTCVEVHRLSLIPCTIAVLDDARISSWTSEETWTPEGRNASASARRRVAALTGDMAETRGKLNE